MSERYMDRLEGGNTPDQVTRDKALAETAKLRGELRKLEAETQDLLRSPWQRPGSWVLLGSAVVALITGLLAAPWQLFEKQRRIAELESTIRRYELDESNQKLERSRQDNEESARLLEAQKHELLTVRERLEAAASQAATATVTLKVVTAEAVVRKQEAVRAQQANRDANAALLNLISDSLMFVYSQVLSPGVNGSLEPGSPISNQLIVMIADNKGRLPELRPLVDKVLRTTPDGNLSPDFDLVALRAYILATAFGDQSGDKVLAEIAIDPERVEPAFWQRGDHLGTLLSSFSSKAIVSAEPNVVQQDFFKLLYRVWSTDPGYGGRSNLLNILRWPGTKGREYDAAFRALWKMEHADIVEQSGTEQGSYRSCTLTSQACAMLALKCALKGDYGVAWRSGAPPDGLFPHVEMELVPYNDARVVDLDTLGEGPYWLIKRQGKPLRDEARVMQWMTAHPKLVAVFFSMTPPVSLDLFLEQRWITEEELQ